MLTVEGYMVRATFDGDTFTAEGTNKAAQIALRGQERNEGPVVLPVENIARVENKPASRLTNGNLSVWTRGGQRFQLHYRRKHTDDMAALATALSTAAQT